MNTFYFAYGSNMNPVRIRQRIPQARLVGMATIKGWRLVERLYADIERAKGRTVEGVLYLVSQTELYRLDSYEGFPSVYGSVKVNAWLDAKHCVAAQTYMMTATTKAATSVSITVAALKELGKLQTRVGTSVLHFPEY